MFASTDPAKYTFRGPTRQSPCFSSLSLFFAKLRHGGSYPHPVDIPEILPSLKPLLTVPSAPLEESPLLSRQLISDMVTFQR